MYHCSKFCLQNFEFFSISKIKIAREKLSLWNFLVMQVTSNYFTVLYLFYSNVNTWAVMRAEVFVKNYFLDKKTAPCCVTIVRKYYNLSEADIKSNKHKANISLPRYLWVRWYNGINTLAGNFENICGNKYTIVTYRHTHKYTYKINKSFL